MPLTRRRGPSSRPTIEADDLSALLLNGPSPFIPSPEPEGLATAWHERRAALLRHWMQDPARFDPTDPHRPGGPCSRPWGWWCFDSPEPRALVGKLGPVALVHALNAPAVSWRRSWGIGPGRPSAYEAEVDYLARLGLLTRAEAAGNRCRRGTPRADSSLDRAGGPA